MMMRSEARLISTLKWKMRDEKALETEDRLEMEENAKSVNGTRQKKRGLHEPQRYQILQRKKDQA